VELVADHDGADDHDRRKLVHLDVVTVGARRRDVVRLVDEEEDDGRLAEDRYPGPSVDEQDRLWLAGGPHLENAFKDKVAVPLEAKVLAEPALLVELG